MTLPRLLRVASFRFAAFYVVLFAASALLLGIAVFVEARSALEQQMTARIETETAFLKEEFGGDGLEHLKTVLSTRGQGPSALDYLLQGPGGAHLAGEIPAIPGLAPGWATLDVPYASEDGGRPERVRALVTGLGGGTLLAVGADLRQIGDLEEAVATAFGWAVGLAALLGISGGLLLSRSFLRRVDDIGRTAEAIIAGDGSRRIPLRGTGDDLDRLAGTLNRMLDRNARLIDSLRQVSSDVAHDLRTPLARLYQRLEGARTHARSMAEYEAAIEAALLEAQSLLDTFAALLRIAQLEGHASRASFAPVDLASIAETVVDAYRLDAEQAGHRLESAAAPPTVVQGDKELLTQAVANLVENALRHTPSGTRIAVEVGAGPVGPRLAVEDDGPGVTAAELLKLTQRFYRAEESRTTSGNGLGLSLVAAVAELHGAHLQLEGAQPGLRARLLFPPLQRMP